MPICSWPNGTTHPLWDLFSTLSHKTLAIGEASLLSPCAYVGLIYATIWGLIFFGEFPDPWSIIEAITIAISDFYIWYRDTFGSKSEAEDAN